MSLKLISSVFLVTLIITLSFPVASALTPRTNFNDDSYTNRPGGIRICGDHVCFQSEYSAMHQALSQSQMKGKTNSTTIQNTNSSDYQIPTWIKNNAKWWSQGAINDSEFTQGIQYMIKQAIVKIPPTSSSLDASSTIPTWIKNNAGWWASGTISDKDFVKGIQWLISNGIIKV